MATRVKEGQEIVVVNTGQSRTRRAITYVGEQHNKTGLGFGLGGALLAWVVGLDSVNQMELVKKNWWVLPAALLLLGYYLWKRNYKYAAAVIAVGGCLLVQMWRKQSEQQKKATANDPNANKTTQGVEDFKWIQAPNGELVGIPYSKQQLTEGDQSNLSLQDLAEQITKQVYARAA